MAAPLATLITALAVTLAGPAPATPATARPATPSSVQAQINAHLRAYPGGVQTGPAEISYDNGAFVMTFIRPDAGPGTAATADCPGGWFCFYDRVDFGYPRGKLSDCGWQDLARWGWQNRTESVHYNKSSGSVAFINHADGVSHHVYDVNVFGVGTDPRTIADVTPYRNTADHVNRYC